MMKFHEAVRIKVSTQTIRDNLRLLEKVEEKARRSENNSLTLDAPSLIDQKQVLRRSK
jgi:hypothetical protein